MSEKKIRKEKNHAINGYLGKPENEHKISVDHNVKSSKSESDYCAETRILSR